MKDAPRDLNCGRRIVQRTHPDPAGSRRIGQFSTAAPEIEQPAGRILKRQIEHTPQAAIGDLTTVVFQEGIPTTTIGQVALTGIDPTQPLPIVGEALRRVYTSE